MIIIKHNCSKCKDELSFQAGDISRKYEHLTVKTGDSLQTQYELSGHKFIVCPCCGEMNILGPCSDITSTNPFDITRRQELKNHYGIIAMQRCIPESDSEWTLYTNYDKDVPAADGKLVIKL